MAQFTFDEREISQLYVAAKEFGTKLLKARREAIKMDLSSPAIAEYDDQIHRNTELRTVLNPRAEEEARAAARRKRGERFDPRQLDLEQEITVAAEPNGNGKKAKKPKRVSTAAVVDGMDVVNPEKTEPPTDELLSRRLWEVCGLTIGTDVVHKWTSSERDAAEKYIALVHARSAAITSGKDGAPPPEPPDKIWAQMWRGRYEFNPRGSALMESAPAKEREYWADQGPFTIRKDGSGSQAKFFTGAVLDGDLHELEITDKRGLSRFREAAIARMAQLNRTYHSRLLVGGTMFAAHWVIGSMRFPGKGLRYVAPACPPEQEPNAQDAATEAR